MPSASEHAGWWQERATPTRAASPTAEATTGSPQADPEVVAKNAGRPADSQRAPLPNPVPLAGNGAAEESAAADPGPTRVLIHHQAGTRGAVSAIQLAAYLQAQGFAVTDIRAVDTPIEHPGVRYFFEGDRSDSRRLVEAIGAFFAKTPDQAPHEPVDLSHLSPKPGQGYVEVWLPGPGSDKAS